MDNLTHTLIGVALGKAGLEKKIGSGTTWILALSSNLPDLDALISLFGIQDSFLLRRTLTHSIPDIPIIALLFAWFFSAIWKNIGFWRAFGLILLGMGLHTFFDLMNSYGVVLFYPLSPCRYEFAWLFIIDLAIWGLLLLPFLLERIPFVLKNPGRKISIWRASIVLFAAYVGLCGWGRTVSQTILEEESKRLQLAHSEPYVFPEALGCHRFRGVISNGDERRMYVIYPFVKKIVFFRSFVTAENDVRVINLAGNRRFESLMNFFKCPVFEFCAPDRLRVYDLRFVSTVITFSPTAFSFEFEVPPKLVSWILSSYTLTT